MWRVYVRGERQIEGKIVRCDVHHPRRTLLFIPHRVRAVDADSRLQRRAAGAAVLLRRTPPKNRRLIVTWLVRQSPRAQ